MKTIYCASRASIRARVDMWRRLRSEGWPIISSWIDLCLPSSREAMAYLWQVIQQEVAACDGLLGFAEPGDFPLKGALVEIGMALSLGKPVVLVGKGWGDASWINHPMVYSMARMPTRFEIFDIFDVIRESQANTRRIRPYVVKSGGCAYLRSWHKESAKWTKHEHEAIQFERYVDAQTVAASVGGTVAAIRFDSKNNFSHEFDSSLTCNYCGITASDPDAKGLCASRCASRRGD